MRIGISIKRHTYLGTAVVLITQTGIEKAVVTKPLPNFIPNIQKRCKVTGDTHGLYSDKNGYCTLGFGHLVYWPARPGLSCDIRVIGQI